MTTIDFITELFCQVDDSIDDSKHPQSNLHLSDTANVYDSSAFQDIVDNVADEGDTTVPPRFRCEKCDGVMLPDKNRA